MKETNQQCKNRWSKDAHKHLQGRTIVSVRYLSEEEQEAFGWWRSGVMLILDDGNWIAPMQDDEGNGPGAIATSFKGLATIPVI